jgi:riboflavin kinase/FMN adenylyltransferase
VEIHYQLPTQAFPHSVVTMGIFDGIHQGHQALIRSMIKEAKENNGNAVLLTFDPHPKKVLYPDDQSLKMIQTMEEKISILQKIGLDHLVILPFTQEISRLSAEDFVRQIFVKGLGAKKIYMGYDHRFGRNRLGDFELMQNLAPLYSFELAKMEAIQHFEEPISSTKIRTALREGNISSANAMLGRNFQLSGRVIHGKKLGRTIQIPTANVDVENENKFIPKNGVYSAWAYVPDHPNPYKCALNIGYRPTVDQTLQLHIEAHLLDFNMDIYDNWINLELVDRIRDEQKFDSLAILVEQIKKDIECIRQSLR